MACLTTQLTLMSYQPQWRAGRREKPAAIMLGSWKLDCFGRRQVVTQSRSQFLPMPRILWPLENYWPLQNFPSLLEEGSNSLDNPWRFPLPGTFCHWRLRDIRLAGEMNTVRTEVEQVEERQVCRRWSRTQVRNPHGVNSGGCLSPRAGDF